MGINNINVYITCLHRYFIYSWYVPLQIDPADYVEHLAEAMQVFLPADYLRGDSVLSDYDVQVNNSAVFYNVVRLSFHIWLAADSDVPTTSADVLVAVLGSVMSFICHL